MTLFALDAREAHAATMSQLHSREHRQLRTLHRHVGTVRFFRTHRHLARTHPGRRALRVARTWIAVVRRELRQTRAELRARARPPTPWPSWWFGQALCVHSREGAWNANTGNGYYGGMQFLLSTWQSVGGRGYPHEASPYEQLYRAWLVYRRDGSSWREWGTAGMCGLR